MCAVFLPWNANDNENSGSTIHVRHYIYTDLPDWIFSPFCRYRNLAVQTNTRIKSDSVNIAQALIPVSKTVLIKDVRRALLLSLDEQAVVKLVEDFYAGPNLRRFIWEVVTSYSREFLKGNKVLRIHGLLDKFLMGTSLLVAMSYISAMFRCSLIMFYYWDTVVMV